jgi:ankyrin repeat protein
LHFNNNIGVSFMLSSPQSPKAFDQLMAIIQKDHQQSQPEKDMLIAAALVASDESCLNQIDPLNDWQLIHFAILSDHPLAIELVKLLCEVGANINAQSRTGETPLHLAVSKNKAECVRYLLARGADLSLRDCDGLTAQKLAEKKGICKKEFAQVSDLRPSVVSEPEALFNCLAVAGPSQASMLNSAEMHALCLELMSLDFLAARSKLEQDYYSCHVNSIDEKGWTLLHHAVAFNPAIYRSRVELIKLLCMLGAEVNALTTLGESPLHLASCHGNAEYVAFLLQQKANPLLKDAEGRTALHLAIMSGQEYCANVLLARMGDELFHFIDAKRQTLLHFSAEIGSPQGLKLLNFALINSQCEESKIKDFANLQDLHGKTALHHAALGGQVECIKILLAMGAELNLQDHAGNTPLHCAAYNCLQKEGVAVARLLIRANANPTIRNQFGQHWCDIVGELDSAQASEVAGDLERLLDVYGAISNSHSDSHQSYKSSDQAQRDSTPLLLIPVSNQRVIAPFWNASQSSGAATAAQAARTQVQTVQSQSDEEAIVIGHSI